MAAELNLAQYAASFTSLFAIVDPFAAIPLFLAMTERFSSQERQRIIRRACLIACGILCVFALCGEFIFRLFGISILAFRIAGGILLLLFGIEQLSSRRQRVQDDEETESFARNDLSIFPIATPLLAGPGAISTTVLNASQSVGFMATVLHSVMIMLVFLATFLILKSAPLVLHVLGKTGINLLTRLMGILLTAIAVQYIVDGIRAILTS